MAALDASEAAAHVPSDEHVIRAVRELRKTQPELGRAKVLAELKRKNEWSLSDARVKKLMDQHDLNTPNRNVATLSTQPPTSQQQLPPIPLPDDAFAAQQQYKDNSTRCFKLYGRGKYNYGITPNSDMAVMIDIAHNRLRDHGRPSSVMEKMQIGGSWPLKTLWDYYWAAAQMTGELSKEDIGRQLEAEYGVNPIPCLPPPPTMEEEAQQKAEFKEKSLATKREMLKHAETRKYIPTGPKGEPVWDEKKMGQFALLVVKIDKGDGLDEFGPL